MEKINTDVFLKVVQTGSFTVAASELGYTQAGVSYIINAMEKELGLKLFIREYGGVKLSPEGKELLHYIEQIHRAEKLLMAKTNEIKCLDTGSVSVRVFSSVAVNWLPGIMEIFREKYPGINVDIVSNEYDEEVERMIHEQVLDCGFFDVPLHSELETIMLHESPMMISVSPKHPLAEHDKVPINELLNYPFIRMSYDDKEHYLHEIISALGEIPKASYLIDNDYAALAMASKDMGYCLFSKMMLQNIPFELKHIELYPRKMVKFFIATKSLKNCSKATKAFIDCVTEWVDANVR